MNYRLKKEAVPFFLDKYATTIQSLDAWERIGVDIKALEEVKPAYISYGQKTSENGKSLSGWSRDNGSHFHFTIHFPSVKMMEHDKFNKGKTIRGLMNKIQNQVDYFFDEFVSEVEQ